MRSCPATKLDVGPTSVISRHFPPGRTFNWWYQELDLGPSGWWGVAKAIGREWLRVVLPLDNHLFPHRPTQVLSPPRIEHKSCWKVALETVVWGARPSLLTWSRASKSPRFTQLFYRVWEESPVAVLPGSSNTALAHYGFGLKSFPNTTGAKPPSKHTQTHIYQSCARN